LVLPGFEPNPGNACNRRDVTDEIEVEFVVERRIARVGGSDYEKRVAVRGRFCDRLGGDIAARTRPVLDDEWMIVSQSVFTQVRRETGKE
jgi:hypothetical protein